MNSDWKGEVVANRVVGVRDQERLDGAAHRLEIQLEGETLSTLRLTCSARFDAVVLGEEETLFGAPDPAWKDSHFVVGEPKDKKEIDRLFHRLWGAAVSAHQRRASVGAQRSRLTTRRASGSVSPGR